MSCGCQCSQPGLPDGQDQWPLMVCLACGNKQTFAGRFVVNGMAHGVCDNCGPNRYWKLNDKAPTLNKRRRN